MFSKINPILLGAAAVLSSLVNITPLQAQSEATDSTDYTLVVSGFDWGAAANKVILSVGEEVTSANASDYYVSASRSTELTALLPQRSNGTRQVVFAYVSDAEGHRTDKGSYITLVLSVGPDDQVASPMEYIDHRNRWIDYKLSITDSQSGRTWDTESSRIRPVVDQFDLTGTYTHKDGKSLTYAAFEPQNPFQKKSPLIIWLHGGGEGGTDPSIALMANLASNYAAPEIQAIFDGAYVLAPQTPTFWMEAEDNGHTRGDQEDVQHAALMGLIKSYVKEHPGIDKDRIYVGGCSNGGYMTLKLLLENPDFFAAAYPSALGYFSEYLTDEQVESIKHIPIWFVHAADDHTLEAEQTAVPIYKRLKAAGAPNVHLSLYDHVIDIRGFYGGSEYWYNGHFSWIYSHANQCRLDYGGTPVRIEGRPVTIMEWMAAQQR